MTTLARTTNGTIEIAYTVDGPPHGEPLLLVMGLGMQMIFWPDGFVAELVARGFTVARFDNRDVGLSTHLTGHRPASLPTMLARPAAGAVYDLDDMADDAVAVLDALDWSSAHIVGASLGGMIAQTVAVRHPSRVRTLTSIMSTPSPRIGRPRPRALRVLVGHDARDREQAARRMVRVFRVIGSPGYPHDEAWLREAAAQAYDRAHDPAGVRRQLAAIAASGDRRAGLANLRIPALVLHGEADPLVRPSGGRATAAAIPGARLVTYPGMGHDLPGDLWSTFADEIAALAATSGNAL
ncbi:MAG TPA: alpha/beta hydrolase [Micromonosporaceae bacterium]